MMRYNKDFIVQMKKVDAMKKALREEQLKLYDLCPHVHLDGSSAFPSGISFTDCTICGESSYYASKGRSKE